MQKYSFSKLFTQSVDRLVIPVKVYQPDKWIFQKVLALLDTGATNSAISRELVEKLELTLIDRILVGGVHGEYFLQQYKAGFELPWGYHIEKLPVIECILDGQDIDAIIGMDILWTGDLMICQQDGKTLISFITPHQQAINLEEVYHH